MTLPVTLPSWSKSAVRVGLALAVPLGLLGLLKVHDTGVAKRAVAHAAVQAADSTAAVWRPQLAAAAARGASFKRERDSLRTVHVRDSVAAAVTSRRIRLVSPTVIAVDTSDRHPGAPPAPPVQVVVPPELTDALAAKDRRIADLERDVAVRDSIIAADSARAVACDRLNAALTQETRVYQAMQAPRFGFKTGGVVGVGLTLLTVWAAGRLR